MHMQNIYGGVKNSLKPIAKPVSSGWARLPVITLHTQSSFYTQKSYHYMECS